MTQEDTVDVQEEAEEASAGQAHCRHCGQPGDADASGDWLCRSCERYQDTMACPVCHQPARISLMTEDLAPPVHAPARRRKTKE